MTEAERIAEAIIGLDKTLHEKVRLAIVTILFHTGKKDFNSLLRIIKTSEGNMATHLKALENEGYLKVRKRFVGRKPQTLYELTEKGKKAYREYLKKLAEALKMTDKG